MGYSSCKLGRRQTPAAATAVGRNRDESAHFGKEKDERYRMYVGKNCI